MINDQDEDYGPEFEDGPASDGFHCCSPYNGGHNWTMPYRVLMSWVVRCNKCCQVREDK